jgi:pectin methylesterase-like acyl-CoA thioesterase
MDNDPYIQQTIENGTSTQINITLGGQAVMEYMAKINGQIVIVRAVQMGKDLIQITDAWVKTKIQKRWRSYESD